MEAPRGRSAAPSVVGVGTRVFVVVIDGWISVVGGSDGAAVGQSRAGLCR